MKEFHYLPPSSQDQRAFVMQFLGTLLGLIVVAFLIWYSPAFELRAVLLGAGAAIVWMLGAAAWRLEKKARRSQLAKVAFDNDMLYVTDRHGKGSKIPWENITSCEVKGGKLLVQWNSGELHVGARELENGMSCVQTIAKKVHGDKSTFIPLSSVDVSHEPPHSLSHKPRQDDQDSESQE